MRNALIVGLAAVLAIAVYNFAGPKVGLQPISPGLGLDDVAVFVLAVGVSMLLDKVV